jgi:hypothetical protein
MKCPNEGCSKELSVQNLAAHNNTCEHALLKCKYATYGCAFVGSRKDMAKHDDACNIGGVGVLVEKIRSLEASLAALQTTVGDVAERSAQSGNMALTQVQTLSANIARDRAIGPHSALNMVKLFVKSVVTPVYWQNDRQLWHAVVGSEEGLAYYRTCVHAAPTLLILACGVYKGLNDMWRMKVAVGDEVSIEQMNTVFYAFLTSSSSALFLLTAAFCVRGKPSNLVVFKEHTYRIGIPMLPSEIQMSFSHVVAQVTSVASVYLILMGLRVVAESTNGLLHMPLPFFPGLYCSELLVFGAVAISTVGAPNISVGVVNCNAINDAVTAPSHANNHFGNDGTGPRSKVKFLLREGWVFGTILFALGPIATIDALMLYHVPSGFMKKSGEGSGVGDDRGNFEFMYGLSVVLRLGITLGAQSTIPMEDRVPILGGYSNASTSALVTHLLKNVGLVTAISGFYDLVDRYCFQEGKSMRNTLVAILHAQHIPVSTPAESAARNELNRTAKLKCVRLQVMFVLHVCVMVGLFIMI